MNIFLSYARADVEWVDELVTALQDSAFKIDHGVSDSDQRGNRWEPILRRTIESADLVVSVLTIRSLHNPWFLFELGAATSARKAILPLLVGENGRFAEVPKGMEGYHFSKVESPSQAAEQIKRYAHEQMAEI